VTIEGIVAYRRDKKQIQENVHLIQE